MDLRLDGKVALVTGASKGIGRAIATQMAASGAQVMISSRKQDALEETASTMDGEVGVFAANAGEPDQIEACVAATVERFGRLDILVNNAYMGLRSQHDPDWGGFGNAPKFPQTMSLDLLLRAYAHNEAPQTLQVVTTSLDAMASGGIYDHIGGGFARYSVDTFWMVPHFEKMLYDQALLTRVYAHAWQVTNEDRYWQVLRETIGYVERDLRHPDGGFFSAEDADSEGEEGKFYVWRQDEIEEVLDPKTAAAVIEWYGVSPNGNFEGSNILHRPVRGQLKRPPLVEEGRKALFEAREKRVRPGRDDKVLTEWNALMISAIVDATLATDDFNLGRAAVPAAEFLLANLRRDDGRWLRSWQAAHDDQPARAQHLAYAADYAALVDAFTRLSELKGEARWINEARTTADAMLDLFWDDDQGGLFTTGHDAEALIARQKDFQDNATPSANSQAAYALLRLGALTGEPRYTEKAEAILRLFAPLADRYPSAFSHLLAALDLATTGLTEIVFVGEGLEELRMFADGEYLPNAVVAWGEPYDSPLWEGREPGKVYVCENYACQLPVSTLEDLQAQIKPEPSFGG